jgi:hypothetical protein
MYVHLGSSVVIPQEEILGVFDLDNTTSSRITRDFLTQAQHRDQVVSVGEDLPKSFLLCRTKTGETKVYLSQLSPATLQKRIGTGGLESV